MSLHSAPAQPTGAPERKPVTLRTLRAMARDGRPFACVACYDATTARWVERGGVHCIIVGDSAAQVVLGLPSTIHMPLEVAVALTAGVKRGAPRTVVMADMPFMSYQCSEEQALRNAGRFMTEGLADIVKIEADASFGPLVERMTRAGIPVCAHIGLRPQSAALDGGYLGKGRTAEEAERIARDALALERAGASMLLVEAVPDALGARITGAAGVPVIGIGAGTACHGQVLVLQDLLGMTERPPVFAEQMAQVGPMIQRVASEWADRVARRIGGAHRYEMKPESPAGGTTGDVMHPGDQGDPRADRGDTRGDRGDRPRATAGPSSP
ncbi:MAG TPA: 3-methyl-2-oxobutanoate hydroxymethyltransferase [Phycisphaerales bacterium]|nr:3-methyl-2-oxobutanoate hydroxymethyltransferase [Phycisphaerales bacterium]